MSIELITILIFGTMLFLLLMGLPVAFSCGVTGVIFTALLQGPSAVNIVPTRIFGLMVNYLLAAIPLFIFMAYILERGGDHRRHLRDDLSLAGMAEGRRGHGHRRRLHHDGGHGGRHRRQRSDHGRHRLPGDAQEDMTNIWPRAPSWPAAPWGF